MSQELILTMILVIQTSWILNGSPPQATQVMKGQHFFFALASTILISNAQLPS